MLKDQSGLPRSHRPIAPPQSQNNGNLLNHKANTNFCDPLLATMPAPELQKPAQTQEKLLQSPRIKENQKPSK